MVCCLTSTSKYFIYIHDENKFNNIYKIIQKWGRDRALWLSFFWVVQPCIPSIWLLFEILSKFSLNNHYFNIFDWNELKFKWHSSYLEMNCMKYVPWFSVKFKILKILEKKKSSKFQIYLKQFIFRKKKTLPNKTPNLTGMALGLSSFKMSCSSAFYQKWSTIGITKKYYISYNGYFFYILIGLRT